MAHPNWTIPVRPDLLPGPLDLMEIRWCGSDRYRLVK
jgi:hypothetical protein